MVMVLFRAEHSQSRDWRGRSDASLSPLQVVIIPDRDLVFEKTSVFRSLFLIVPMEMGMPTFSLKDFQCNPHA